MGVAETGGVMLEVSKVFSFLSDLYGYFPTVVKLVLFGVFGSVILVAMLRGVGR